MIELTLFKSVFDNKTHNQLRLDDWDQFGTLLSKMSKMDGYKPRRGDRRKGSPLISPAIYERGKTRSNDNVVHWSKWAALDVDDFEGSMEDVMTLFQDYSFYCYSSASSTKAKPKFRVVLNVMDDIPAENIQHFWYALNKEFDSIIDPQTKDVSRMYYVPAQYPDAYNFIFHNQGKQVDPKVFMLRHAYTFKKADLLSKLPEAIQRDMIRQKMDNLDNYNIVWTSYRDCPFVNPKMLNHYAQICGTDGTGRYAYVYSLMLNIAGNAMARRYPITPSEIAGLIRDIDHDHGRLYKNRPLELEAERALDFAIKTAKNPAFL